MKFGFEKIGSGTTPDSNRPDYYCGDTPWLTSSELHDGTITQFQQSVTAIALRDYSALKVYPVGSLVVAMYGATMGRMGILGFPTAVNQACCVFAKPTTLDPRFALYSLLTKRTELLSQAVGAGQPNLNSQTVANVSVLAPPIARQRLILNFLDRETAKIDDLIAKKRSLIELLDEKRSALISRAVTLGLDHGVPIKDSGLDWLGNIPSHWHTISLRRLLVGIEQGVSPVAEDCVAGQDEYAVLKLSAVKRGHFYPAEHKRLPDWSHMPKDLLVKTGDLLLTRANTPELVGDACVVSDIRQPLLLPDLIFRLNVRSKEILPRFLMYILVHGYGRHQIQADARGSSGSMVKISQSHIREWLVCLPRLSEQALITTYCEDVERSVSSVYAAVTACITLLREYRSALITDAVTGQLDIREHETKMEALA